ncbi:arylesterase [Niastella koreensis]|uniref:Lipolytic protein G-D-S-L family n=2 Tax=Niastella koreensis TaxID=354356 RepID=G8TMV1_NIAKG|nr:arylesterase [Niastella koreensis]AEV96613.1 lipolytic protein G-D-S-L family [Niastella koreensis GR20-10]OQP54125.1 arylesterase [Niastella koreensis]
MKKFNSTIYMSGKYLFVGMLLLALLGSCGNNADKTNDTGKQKREQLPAQAGKEKAKTIVFFGNSLTAGYGVDPSEAFPALVQEKIDSLHLPYKVVNAGLSGETTAGGKSRIDWILRQPVDIFVLELGGNDGLRGIPIAETSRNLQAIISRVREKNPQVKIVLAGMQVPPNMGRTYASAFRVVFQQLAANNQIDLIPFLLENVGGISHLNQADGIHPNPQGHKIVAENVWRVIQGLL